MTEYWQTLSGDGAAVWNRMDGEEHVGYHETPAGTYDVWAADGRRSTCFDCEQGDPDCHTLFPESFIGEADTEHEAAMLLQNYCKGQGDDVTFQGKEPIQRRSAKHPRAGSWLH